MMLNALDSAYRFKSCLERVLSTSDDPPFFTVQWAGLVASVSHDQPSLFLAGNIPLLATLWLGSHNSIPLSFVTDDERSFQGDIDRA